MSPSLLLGTTERVALTDLVHRYAALVDAGEVAAVAALFTEDGVLATPSPPRVLDPDTEHHGRAAVVDALGALAAMDATFHAVTGAVFDTGHDAGTATGRVNGFAHHVSRRHGEPVDLVWAVRYRDDYVHVDAPDVWRFSRRAVHVAFVETRPLKVARTP
ncbi:MAG: nuclear transport factor 2 family protein [Nocardioides sp.]|nr:nuclear transport factor 2 family protein [Nocardioides sp.]